MSYPAEKATMTAGLFARAPRLAVLVAVALLATAGLTFAASSTLSAQPTATTETTPELPPLVVPDVRQQAYVFAKGMLEQGGFAWRVEGAVHGYSANVVAAQTPAPGTKLVANGAPTIVLRLQRNAGYAEQGAPRTRLRTPASRPESSASPRPRPRRKPKVEAKPKVAARCEDARRPLRPRRRRRLPRRPRRPRASLRSSCAGAPAEPLDEMTLCRARAKQLNAWVSAHPKRTPAAVDHWLYQHNWIVSGAKFGWSHGAEALQLSSPSTSASRPSGASAATARPSPGKPSST